MALDDCRLIDLPRFSDARGNLTFVEGGAHIPFEVRRIYYLYDVPEGSERGVHAHKNLHQLVIAMSGSFDIWLNDGKQERHFHLNRAHCGLYICPMIWRRLENFSSGSVCMVLASEKYDPDDYIHEYSDFLKLARGDQI